MVFGALTGLAVDTGYGARAERANLGSVKVPDLRVDALSKLYTPKKTTYAEITFSDLGPGHERQLDRQSLNAMRGVDALCQVLRGFSSDAGRAPDPLSELKELETETLLADLQVVEQRVERLRKDRSSPRELELLEGIQESLETEQPLRQSVLSTDEHKILSGYSLLTLKPLLLVLNVGESELGTALSPALEDQTHARSLGIVRLCAPLEMDIAQMEAGEQQEFAASLGFEEPAKSRFIRAAFALIDLISMLTVGPDECRAWPIGRGTPAPKAAGKIHSDIERGFIRAEVVPWQELIDRGSEAKCKEAGVLRVEGKDYIVQDGDVVNFRFNV